MAEFIYTTSLTIRAPWLIDADKLESLDTILDEEWARLSRRNEERLTAEIEEKLRDDYILNMTLREEEYEEYLKRISKDEHYQENASSDEIKKKRRDELTQKRRAEIRSELLMYTYSGYKENRSITIHLKKDKRVVVKSFGEALRQQSLVDEIPVGFEVSLKSGDIRCDIELRKNRGTLDISVSPEHETASRELFATLQRWSSGVRPPRWQQVWVLLNPLQWILWIILLWFPLLFLSDTKTAAKNIYKEQASQILREGIKQDNQIKAIEVLLALESEYIPPNIAQTSTFPGWYKLLFFGGIIICTILSFTPKSVLGIGKGQEVIKRWRIWMRIVFIIVPSFIFLNIIWPYISSLFLGRQ